MNTENYSESIKIFCKTNIYISGGVKEYKSTIPVKNG